MACLQTCSLFNICSFPRFLLLVLDIFSVILDKCPIGNTLLGLTSPPCDSHRSLAVARITALAPNAFAGLGSLKNLYFQWLSFLFLFLSLPIIHTLTLTLCDTSPIFKAHSLTYSHSSFLFLKVKLSL